MRQLLIALLNKPKRMNTENYPREFKAERKLVRREF